MMVLIKMVAVVNTKSHLLRIEDMEGNTMSNKKLKISNYSNWRDINV